MKQEALLPGTDAIPSGVIELMEYRGRWLVRQRRLDGSVRRELFRTASDAFEVFLRWVEELRIELAKLKPEKDGRFLLHPSGYMKAWIDGYPSS